MHFRKAVLVQDFEGEAVVNILKLLRLDLIGGGPGDTDVVEWQCLKNNQVMLTADQWRALTHKVNLINSNLDRLEKDLQRELEG